jgi:hypothetical protein
MMRVSIVTLLALALLATPLVAETFSGSCQAISFGRCRSCWRVIVAR